jgi:hypothetical protein
VFRRARGFVRAARRRTPPQLGHVTSTRDVQRSGRAYRVRDESGVGTQALLDSGECARKRRRDDGAFPFLKPSARLTLPSSRGIAHEIIEEKVIPRTIDPRDLREEVARFAEAPVAAGRFATIGAVVLAGKEALERQAYEERVEALRRAGEHGLTSLREHGPQLESDEDFEAFMDEAEAEALRIPISDIIATACHPIGDCFTFRSVQGRAAFL